MEKQSLNRTASKRGLALLGRYYCSLWLFLAPGSQVGNIPGRCSEPTHRAGLPCTQSHDTRHTCTHTAGAQSTAGLGTPTCLRFSRREPPSSTQPAKTIHHPHTATEGNPALRATFRADLGNEHLHQIFSQRPQGGHPFKNNLKKVII